MDQRFDYKPTLRPAVALSAAVTELAQLALTGIGLGELFSRACDLLCPALDVDSADILQGTGNGDSLLLVAGSGWPDDVQVGLTTVPRGDDSQAGFALREDSTVIVEDFAAEERFAPSPLVVDHGLRSGMSVPIFDGEQPYAVLSVHSRRSRKYTQDEVEFLRQVSDVLGAAVHSDQARLDLALRALAQERRLRFPAALAECAQSLLASSGEDRLLHALEALQVATDATYIFVERNVHHPDLGSCSETVVEAVKPGAPEGLDDPYWELIPWSRMPTSRAHLERGESFLLIPSELTGPEYDVYADDPYPIQSELDIPIFVDGEWEGLVGLADIATVRKWSDEEMSMLSAVASMIGAFWEREAARRRLEELSSHKDRFVATVSHELRTPLTSVLGFVDLLREGGLDADEQAEVLHVVSEEAADLVNLVEDLLTMARAGQESFQVAIVPVDLQAQMRQVLETLGDFESQSLEIEGGAGRASGDPARVRQILRNLITNAIRYGGPTVAIKLNQPEGKWVQLAVEDDGDGIPEADRDRVFEPYERAHHDPGRTESVGLGLAVSRTLARHMGGDLTYSYVDGRSRFALRLPAWLEPADTT